MRKVVPHTQRGGGKDPTAGGVFALLGKEFGDGERGAVKLNVMAADINPPHRLRIIQFFPSTQLDEQLFRP